MKESRGSAVHRKKLKTPLTITLDHETINVIPGPWKSAIKTAKALAGEISEANPGKYVRVYERGNLEPIWIARLKYANDDPIWKATPSHEDCRRLFSAVIERVFLDAGLITAPCFGEKQKGGKDAQDYAAYRKKHNQNYARFNPSFSEVCELAGVDPGWMKREFKKRKWG
jgi:hypothetical protein